jgi:DNA-binding transcriptional ArsR family regulator
MKRDVFQAIADPTRRKIINLLVRQSLTLNGISRNFKISRPAVSKHIKILEECGVIHIHQKGRERICIADLKKLKLISEWVSQYQLYWTNN